MYATFYGSQTCCGVMELSGIYNDHTYYQGRGGTTAQLEFLCQRLKTTKVAYVTFTGVSTPSSQYGEALAQGIQDERLGTVWGSEVTTNPNSKNPLRIWVWTLDYKAIAAFLERRQPVTFNNAPS